MAERHNLCVNPSLLIDNSGWGGGSTPARVTGLPMGEAAFPVGTGARYTAGSFVRTAAGAVAAGIQYTLSLYLKPANASSGSIYIEWARSAGGPVYSQVPYTAAGGAVTRLGITATAPANAVTAAVILDGVNYGFNTTDMTAVLAEAAAAPPGTYFDGSMPGPPLSRWDGAEGLSPSTLLDQIVPPATFEVSAGPKLWRVTATDELIDAGQGALPSWSITQQ